MQTLKDQYERYLLEAERARQRAGLCDGLFGMGNDPRRASCHQDFYEYVGRWTADFLKSGPDAAACTAAVSWLLRVADGHREQQDVFGYLYAAQGHGLELIARMDRDSAKELLCWYDRTYPKRDRMPVQDGVYKALKKASRTKLW